MIGDALEHVAQIGLRIEIVEPCGAEEAVDIGGSLAAVVGASEQPVLSSQGHSPQRALGRVVIRHAVFGAVIWLAARPSA